MNIAVIIPVVQAKMGNDVLRQLNAPVTRKPDQVIIIDNTSEGFVSPIHASQQIRPSGKSPMPVNASWKLGFSHLRTDIDIVCVINDDIIVNPDFLRRAENLFDTKLNCGIGITAPGNRDKVSSHFTTLNRCHKGKRRSGWAFFIRRTVLDKIPPIPSQLVQFYGDAWLCEWTGRLGYYLYFMVDNIVYHYCGTTFRSGSLNKSRIQRARERVSYYNLLKEYNNGV